MHLEMIGLVRLGAAMDLHLVRKGCTCVIYDRNAQSVEDIEKKEATRADSLAQLAAKLELPRAIWQRGRVIGSWLLDLTATPLMKDLQ